MTFEHFVPRYIIYISTLFDFILQVMMVSCYFAVIPDELNAHLQLTLTVLQYSLLKNSLSVLLVYIILYYNYYIIYNDNYIMYTVYCIITTHFSWFVRD